MRRTLYIILLAAAGILCACQRESTESLRGKGDIVIELGPALQTKADEARDGSKMNNLHIWLVNGSTIVDYLNGGVPYTDENTSYCEISSEDGGATAKAVFAGVDKGEYTLYFVANLPSGLNVSDYQSGGTIDAKFTDHILPAVVDYEPPYDETSGMPLSLVKSISVGAGTNRIYAELVRTCARIRLTVRNNTVGNSLILKKVALSADGNPSTGYLFPRADFSKPGSATMGPFKSLELTTEGQTTDIVIPHGKTYTYIDQYMYETGPNGAVSLGFTLAGGLFADGVTSGVMQVETWSSIEYNASSTASKKINTETKYLIKSNTGNYYIYDDRSGSLKATTATDASTLMNGTNPELYLWQFSNTSGSTSIQNVGTGNYISLSTSWTGGANLTMSESSSSINIQDYSNNKGFRFYNTNLLGTTYYSISVSSGSVNTVSKRSSISTDSNTYLQLYPVTTQSHTATELNLADNNGNAAEKYFDQTITGLNYIGKYGAPVPLEHIYRNQDVQIVVNVHYNPASGVLYFETSDWVPVDNETTFD